MSLPFQDYNIKTRRLASSMRILLHNIFDKHCYETFGSATHQVGASSIKDFPSMRIMDIMICTKGVLPDIPPDIESQMK